MSKLGLSVLLATVVAAALAASAPGAIRIAKIHYNAPGADTGSNLNGEWFTITNTGNAGRSLAGWRVRDKQGHVYRFGNFRLGAHLTAKIHTGSGHTSGLHRYWGQGSHVWNNDKDTATLKNANGVVVDRCSYNAPAKSEKAC